ncbi:MAG: S26 family signal peptidase [Spirochaetales bacterium]
MKGVSIVIFIILITLFFSFEIFQVEGTSMSPTIPPNSFIVVNKLSFGLHLPWSEKYVIRWQNPNPNEILLFSDPYSGALSIKRCKELTPYGVYLVGDLQSVSLDSRIFGSIPLDQVWGKVIITIPGKGP